MVTRQATLRLQNVVRFLLLLFIQFSGLFRLVTASDGFLINFGGFNASNTRCSQGVGTIGILQMSPIADEAPYVSAGRCLYTDAMSLLNATNVASFSTTFTFSMFKALETNDGQGGFASFGFAFIMVAEGRPEIGFDPTIPGQNLEPLQYLGVLNQTSNGENSSHTFAVEFDVYDSSLSPMFNDPPYDHIGIDLNNMNSSFLAKAGTYETVLNCTEPSPIPPLATNTFVPLNFTDGELIQAWIEYDSQTTLIQVSISSQLGVKPSIPLIKEKIELASIFQDTMYIGFSSAGSSDGQKLPTFIYSWSFKIGEDAAPLYPESINPGCGSIAPATPRSTSRYSASDIAGGVIPPTILLVVAGILVGCYVEKRKRALKKEFYLLELENLESGPITYTYRALRAATQGFDSTQILGCGGFGTVYRGVIGASGREVAVKRICRTFKVMDRDFIADTVKNIGRLRHRNLVHLQGWCHHKQELLLVYELLPQGSLDKYLFGDESIVLRWSVRVDILSGVATALAYLHEECEGRVVHSNVKASNVMLDSDSNARLGDFGFARFCENKQASEIKASAPEAVESGKLTEKSDVCSFGALAVQVVTGRRGIDTDTLPPEDTILVKWIRDLYDARKLVDAVDKRLGNDYSRDEILTILQVALLCSHPNPDERPNMRRVKQMLSGESPVPPLPSLLSRSPTFPSARFELEDSALDFHCCTPEITLIDSPETGLIESFQNSMGGRASLRDSMGKRSRSYGS